MSNTTNTESARETEIKGLLNAYNQGWITYDKEDVERLKVELGEIQSAKPAPAKPAKPTTVVRPSGEHTVKVGLYKDEWVSNLRAVIVRTYANSTPITGTQAEFSAVIHPERVHDYFAMSEGNTRYVGNEVSVVWDDIACGRMDGKKKNPEDKFGEAREIDMYANPCGSFATLVSTWDVDNNKWVHSIRIGDRYGRTVWADRRFSELARLGKDVPAGQFMGRSTAHLAEKSETPAS